MIQYEKFTLSNGLQVYVHPDENTPLAVVNILYNVGSRDEQEDKTGFAHLFEHLMFGGSGNIPNYDEPLQKVGGENNAFTSPDITNYYVTLPAANLETAFWLESDRMMSLSFDPRVLDVQQKVVIEEFKQRYLNNPYGDVWLKLRPVAYTTHPYRWSTIGKEISHIEDATMEDVKRFFYKYYLPNNAIMVVAGNVTVERVKELSEKWFGPIPPGEKYVRNLPAEPEQKEKRKIETSGEVPLNALYKIYHMPPRTSDDYYTADLTSDVVGRGNSSRIYSRLVKKEQMFNSLQAYVTGSVEPGLMVISGKMNEGVSHAEADAALDAVVDELKAEGPGAEELQKVKNQAEATIIYNDWELLSRAMNIAFFANIGREDLINTEAQKIREQTVEGVQAMAQKILRPENSSVLYYHAK